MRKRRIVNGRGKKKVGEKTVGKGLTEKNKVRAGKSSSNSPCSLLQRGEVPKKAKECKSVGASCRDLPEYGGSYWRK